ncbi:3,4-dihydroxy-2-butanone-4-phosphate synthase [Rhodococcus oxybenzonivorans]|uniref:3,4-dihydroxy-2-butanone-4-phosphate synthase n=1 Tax=Rhodococcus oxybenzonivorans TaxID=1990687 RepID=UPI0029554CC3|nr:3,4-dihydroxy-2-butanone-4-phosphate synthase [Rhodococcus oxybenzonivorans]MDV7353671.1 3,4-dihydroxy-2-butanone-4-phosphate synthase [Rhodococcus oxybenzonivorans]
MSLDIADYVPSPFVRDGRHPKRSLSMAEAAYAAGSAVVLFDRDTAFLVSSAASADAGTTSFAIRHGSGFLQVALPVDRCDALQIPEAVPTDRNPSRSTYGQCIGVDAAFGVGTGISATDRARTARVLADPATVPEELTRPGHVMVVRVDSGDKLAQNTFPAVALRLAASAGCTSAVVLTQLVHPDAPMQMSDGPAAQQFACEYGLQAVDVSSLAASDHSVGDYYR